MNIYELTKKEYKEVSKEFQKTYYGKNLLIGCIVLLVIACVALFYAGFQFGYNMALTDLAMSALIIASILMSVDYVMIMLFNIELRKYVESKKKTRKTKEK